MKNYSKLIKLPTYSDERGLLTVILERSCASSANVNKANSPGNSPAPLRACDCALSVSNLKAHSQSAGLPTSARR